MNPQIGRLSELSLDLSHDDLSDLLGAVYSLDGLLIGEAGLPHRYYDLGSGLLGELFQKLTNYHIRTALVVPDPEAHGPRFAELAREHATGRTVRIFAAEAPALAWLEGK